MAGCSGSAPTSARQCQQRSHLALALALTAIECPSGLAAWVTVGQQHPLFLGAATLFLVGGGVRAIAGELEAGTLDATPILIAATAYTLARARRRRQTVLT